MYSELLAALGKNQATIVVMIDLTQALTLLAFELCLEFKKKIFE